ncbi:MAG: hypothetical protein HZA93_13285 [Verrucomicrobia bacterium]|nr:hypothetical protein [Verrucomicrobiota bacterium]
MKKLTAFILLSCAALVAAPTYRVDNLGNCYEIAEDGTETNLGKPIDAMANNPQKAPGIQKAAEKLLADFKASTAAQIKTAQDAAAKQVADATLAAEKAIAANAAELAAAKSTVAMQTQQAATKDAAIAERDARLAAGAAYIAKLQKAIRDAGGTPPQPDN